MLGHKLFLAVQSSVGGNTPPNCSWDVDWWLTEGGKENQGEWRFIAEGSASSGGTPAAPTAELSLHSHPSYKGTLSSASTPP